MVRTLKIGQEEDDVFDEDHEFASTTPDVSPPPKGKVDKRSEQKVNLVRSRHSETEQRRRSKINERFQVLRNLIPESDQKRDKASFLLEVIQYVQFLQEKVRMYEGTCQGWQQRSVLGSIDNFLDQPQLIRDGDNVAMSSKLLTSSQNSIDSDFSESALLITVDNPHMEVNHGINPPQPNLFEAVSAHPFQGSFPEPGFHLADPFYPQQWLSSPSTAYFEGRHDTLKPEKVKPSSEVSSISHDYSQGLLNTLSNALHTSGVDLSHTNISVQLNVRKRIDGDSHAGHATQDGGSSSLSEMGIYAGSRDGHASKKLKTLDSVLPGAPHKNT